MATRRKDQSREAKARRRWTKPFLRELTGFRDSVRETLGKDDEETKRRLVALVLKGVFLKLAAERQLIAVDNITMFADMMKLRRRSPKASNQMELWKMDHVRIAVDNLLEDLKLTGKLADKATLRGFYELLWGFHLDILDRDLLGQVYSTLISLGSRKKKGQYYTPPAVVAAVLDEMQLDPVSNPNLSVLDPACGSGQFLLGVYDYLKVRLMASGMNRQQAHRRVLERHLYGYDIDPFALTITKMNLFLRERIGDPIRFHIHLVDTLSRSEHRLLERTKQEKSYRGFDALVGNPPWGSKLTAAEKAAYRKEYRCAKSGINSFTLFMERAGELVREGGRIGLLIPDAYLNIRAHSKSRNLLLQSMAVERIATCGELFDDVFAPAAILMARREDNAGMRRVSTIRVARDLGSAKESHGEVFQIEFENTPENIFNIHLDARMRRLTSSIAQSSASLKGHATFGLGLVTGDNERLVADRRETPKHEPLIVGRDVHRYRIENGGHWVVYDRDQLQQACPREIFDAPLKLVYRFIGKRLVFACDERRRFTLNNANVLVPMLPGFRPKYVLALLNSPVLQFYYTFSFFTVKVLRGNIERLPLRWAPEKIQETIEREVDSLRLLDEKSFLRQVESIEEKIFDIYGIDEDDRRLIREKLADELGESTPRGDAALG